MVLVTTLYIPLMFDYIYALIIIAMRIYTILINDKPINECYTSLTMLCEAYNIPYYSVNRGKRVFLIAGKAVNILTFKVIRIKGRGRK